MIASARHRGFPFVALVGALLASAPAVAANVFNTGDLVLSIYGNGDGSGNYSDNQASPIVLQDISTSGVLGSRLVLPQASSGANSVISGEYGSSSEGTLQLSANGRLLTIMGYGVNAATFNSAPLGTYGTAALAQSTSVQGGTYTAVARVVAAIDAQGHVDTSTALYNFANTNNPRSVATIDGSAFWVSGQGVKGDTTQGVQYAVDGASSGTVIYSGTDTRATSIVNGQLYVSVDSKQTGTSAKGTSSDIAVFGASLPTTATTPTKLLGLVNSVTLNGNGNGIGSGTVSLSPENFFFANSTTLYVADGGQPKAGDLGDGGLQKWSLVGNTWTLDYTLSAGLGLVSNTAKSGTTGLIGLTGEVVGNQVELFATNLTVGDTDQTYLFGIDDALSATTLPTGESFSILDTAAPDTNIRGVAFAPSAAVPEPTNVALLTAGLGLLAVAGRRRRVR